MAYQSILNPMPITGALTDTQLRLTAVPVSMTSTTITGTVTVSLASTTITGTVAATQSGTWNIGSITTLPALATGANTIGSVKVTDGTNTVGMASGIAASSELTSDRMKVNAELRFVDTSQVAGAQLIVGRGDQTTGLWVNDKNPVPSDLLRQILAELRTISSVLQTGLSVTDDLENLRNDAAYNIN